MPGRKPGLEIAVGTVPAVLPVRPARAPADYRPTCARSSHEDRYEILFLLVFSTRGVFGGVHVVWGCEQ